LGALPLAIIVPIVKYAVVASAIVAIALIVRNNKAEGLSDLKLSKDIENILAQKLTPEESKKVINEFERQRVQAFEEGRKSAGGTIGQLTNLLKVGVVGMGIYFIIKKYS
jgi:hypothetical protein